MNKSIAYIFLFFLILSCNNSTKYSDILNQANGMMDSRPDSAAILLDMIDSPDDLPLSVKADYGYLKSLAHAKTEKAMTEDSLIIFTLDYYKKHNNAGRLGCTYQLAVFYYDWKDDKTAMMEIAQEGLQYNLGVNDSSEIAQSYDQLAGMIESHRDAVEYRLAASRYDTKGSYDRDYEIGLDYAWIDRTDSSAFFIQKSIDSALLHGDTASASHFIRNQADILYSKKKYAESLSLMKKLKEINPVLRSTSYLTFADLYLAMHQPDSAQVYADKARDAKSAKDYSLSVDNHIMTLQIAIDYALNKYIDWGPPGKYNDAVWTESQNQLKIIEEKINVRNQSEQKNLNLTISRQRILLALISVSLLAILLVFLFLFYNWKKKEKIGILQSMLKEAMHGSSANKDDFFFKKILFQQLGLIRLVATSPTAHNQELLKQMSNIANKGVPVDELLNWDDLYPTIDSIYDNFYTNLIRNYGNDLNDREIQLCCLLCAEFSTKEISVVTQQSVRTIYQRKTTIRQKLKMDEKDDITVFLTSPK